VKVFLTGGTGFIGGALAARLRERGDDVVALVRTPSKAPALHEMGCEVVEGDVARPGTWTDALAACDALIHAAALYEIGIRPDRRGAMFDANVRGTENVMRAALDARVPKIVYVSTVNAFGNTRGEVVDESHVHDERYVSYYDQTKHIAHKLTKDLIEREGLPAVIVQPGSVYGPGDKAEVGNVLRMFLDGKLPMKTFPQTGLTFVHRDDVVEGIVLALDKGDVGESYVLGGEIATMGGMIDTAARLTGRKPPRFTMPVSLLKMTAPLGPLLAPVTGFPPNLKEVISASHGVTYWARHDKAAAELGYSPRPFEEGLRQTLEAEGRL